MLVVVACTSGLVECRATAKIIGEMTAELPRALVASQES